MYRIQADIVYSMQHGPSRRKIDELAKSHPRFKFLTRENISSNSVNSFEKSLSTFRHPKGWATQAPKVLQSWLVSRASQSNVNCTAPVFVVYLV